MYPNLQRYLQSHSQMEPVDLIKYCYQSVLGPGHMAPDRQTAAAPAAAPIFICPTLNGWRGAPPVWTSAADCAPRAWPASSA